MFNLMKPKIQDSTQKYVTNMEEYKRLPGSTLRTLEKLWGYEIPEDIIKRLKKSFPYSMMTNEEIQLCIDEFKKYMAIMVIGHSQGRGVAMTSPVIDEIWHTLILFTIEYHKFSQLLDKQYIHHTPNTKSFKFGPDAVSFFYDTYKKYFGELHSIWTYTVIEEKLESPPRRTNNLGSPPLFADNKGGKEIDYDGLVYSSKYQIGKKTLQKNIHNAKVSGIAQGENKSQSSSCGGIFYCGIYTSGYGSSDTGAITESPEINYGDVGGGIGNNFSDDGDGGGDDGCGGCGGCG
jgi:hypothetical protein